MPHQLRVVLLAALLLLAPGARADQTPESVAVVVNGDSWASLTVANEYVRLREIPDGNVVVLHGLGSFDRMDVNQFRDEVLGPVLAAIEERGLAGQIDCVTYAPDIPTSVRVSPDIGDQKLPQVITPVASSNGLTYLHEWVMNKDIEYLRLDINRYARRPLPLPDGEPLTPGETAEYQRGMQLYQDKDFAAATTIIGGLVSKPRRDAGLYYNLACCQALVGENDEAMVSLRRAVSIGWRDAQHTAQDSDLASLTGRADFRALLEEMRARRVEVQPTLGFSASTGWGERGEPSPAGSRYMLSTVLGVTSGRGNSVMEVIECLRRAAQADGTGPRGSVYFMKNGNVRSTTREWGFTDAAEQINDLGVRAVVEDGVLPKNHDDVVGGVIGTATFDWSTSGSTILPGAIVEHLTSCGGMMGERDSQTPCTDLIRAGAAGSSGAVTEPFALQAKFPSPFMHLHYARGSTLAEAFYESLGGPYQLLIIGDPLCRPWGERRRVTASSIFRNQLLRGSIKFKPVISGGTRGVRSVQLYIDGKLAAEGAPGEQMSLDTSVYPDGEHTLTLVAIHGDALGSRDRGVTPVRFDNHGRAVTLGPRPRRRVDFGEPVTVEVSAPGASGVDVTHLGSVVGHADGQGGTVQIDSTSLGLGEVALQVVAHYEGDGPGTVAIGPSVEVEVHPARARRSSRAVPGEGGLSLSVDGGTPVPVPDTFRPNWLSEIGVEAGKPFELTGEFDAPRAGLWQVQLRTNTGATVEIDGEPVCAGAEGGWRYAPCELGAGAHRLRVTGTTPAGNAKARLEIRLGEAGTRCPSESWFRQVTK